MGERSEGIPASDELERRIEFSIGGEPTPTLSELINRARLPGDKGLTHAGEDHRVRIFSRAAVSLSEAEYRALGKTRAIHDADVDLKYVYTHSGKHPRKITLSPEVRIKLDRHVGLALGFQALRAEMLDECFAALDSIGNDLEPNEYYGSRVMQTFVAPMLIKASPETLVYIAKRIHSLAEGQNSETIMTVDNLGIALARTARRVNPA